MDEANLEQPTNEPAPSAGAWDTNAMGSAYDAKTAASPTPEPTEPQPAPAPAPVSPQPESEPVKEPETPASPEPTAATPPPTEDLTLLRESHQAIENLGGLEELEIMQSVAAPLIAPEVDVDGFLNALEDQRGPATFELVLGGIYDRYADSYLRWAFADPDQILANDASLFQDPQRRTEVENLRQDIKDFNSWKAAGRPATSTAAPVTTGYVPPTGTTAAPTAPIPTIPTIDLDDYDIPNEVRAAYKTLQDALGQIVPEVTSLRDKVGNVERLQESERQRIDRERREAETNNQAAQRLEMEKREQGLYLELDKVNERLLSNVRFSTNPNADKAKEEDEETRRDLDARISAEFVRDVQVNPQLQPVFQRALNAHLRGDKVGARADMRTLKEHVNSIAQRHITRYGGRLSAKVAATVTPTQTDNRVVVSGPGSGSSTALPNPPPDQSGSWDPEALGRDFDQRMAQRKGRSA